MSPRNPGEMKSPDAVGRADIHGRAPRCTIYLKVSGDKVEQATFQTFGCGYSIAACSALTELITGKSLTDCRQLTATHVIQTLDGMPEEKQFCARLAIDALQNALDQLKEVKT